MICKLLPLNWLYSELQHHEGFISSIRFIDSNHLLSGSGDATIILWDIEKSKPISTFDSHWGDVLSIDINKHKSIFISGSSDASIGLYDYRMKTSNVPIYKFIGHNTDVNSVKWFPNNNAFVCTGDDSIARLWDIRCWRQLNEYKDTNIICSSYTVDCTKSGYYIIVGYAQQPFCVLWNTLTAEIESNLNHYSFVSVVETSIDGYSLATGCWDKSVRLFC